MRFHHNAYPNQRSESGATGTRKYPAWQRERAGRLHRQFKRCEAALKDGKSLNAALKHFEWYWRGEYYRSDRTKRVRFSLGTLRRLFYLWRRGGRTLEALALHLNPPTRKPSPALVHAFLRACARPDVFTMRRAYRVAAKRRPSSFGWPAIWRALGAENRRAVRRLLHVRRQARSAQIRFARFLAQKGPR